MRNFLMEYFGLRDFFKKRSVYGGKTATRVKRLFVVTPFPIRLLRLLTFCLCSDHCACCYLHYSLALRNLDVFVEAQSWLTAFVFVLLVQCKMELQFTHLLRLYTFAT